MVLRFLLLTLLSVAPFSACLAASQAYERTRITSDVMDIKRKSQTAEFIGNVVVKKGADSLLAEKMTVFYYEKNEVRPINAQGKKATVKRIEAKNNVKIFSSEFVATGDNGYYDPKEEIFVLQDKVVVNKGNSIGTGDKFIYNLITKKGYFVGEQKSASNNKDRRVQVIIGNDINKKNAK